MVGYIMPDSVVLLLENPVLCVHIELVNFDSQEGPDPFNYFPSFF